MNNRIKKYMEYMDLGDDLAEQGKCKVVHKTTIISRDEKGKRVVTTMREDIEFS